VNVAAEIAKLRGELNTAREAFACRVDVAVAKIDGRLGEGQQVMLRLSANMTRLETMLGESILQSQEAVSAAAAAIGQCREDEQQRCQGCKTELVAEVGVVKGQQTRIKYHQAFVAGAGATVVAIIEVFLRLPDFIHWVRN
jgi:hypothetical protein